MTTVSAVFKSHKAADKAIHQLDKAGFSDEQLSFVMSETTRDN